ncbi:PDR/VanB family oxidoreductase [Limibacillus halophilus]|uniref:Vanillate O-demethylase ferredoxin subunit n=1 Tax=Limibacillus halophilus TaxID=1579333 RepID=A0A839SWD7_9PROT|nr:PDR/VanB family oxidoreductase [Limibacillus halophilus]MBB3065994.1 vanillate O-demethylase ferredoxin subunit [Limibacillus halophilus]
MATESTDKRIKLRIARVICETDKIRRYVFESLDATPLPPFTAGANISVFLPNEVVRQYSLCGDPADRSRYEIAVLCEVDGRGGSKEIHRTFIEGGEVFISSPRNLFPLNQDANHNILLAGGIGVTPMIAMLQELESRQASYELHYCTRSIDTTAFLEFLTPRIQNGRVRIYHDGGDPARGLDIDAFLKSNDQDTHLYYCGPSGFMKAVKSASEHWPRKSVHFEYFAASSDENVLVATENSAFKVKIASTGEVFDIPSDSSIVDVLRDNGLPVDTQCEEGYCGSCMTRYLSGEPDHRDSVLDEEDRSQFMLICCSRAKSPCLVLDY